MISTWWMGKVWVLDFLQDKIRQPVMSQISKYDRWSQYMFRFHNFQSHNVKQSWPYLLTCVTDGIRVMKCICYQMWCEMYIYSSMSSLDNYNCLWSVQKFDLQWVVQYRNIYVDVESIDYTCLSHTHTHTHTRTHARTLARTHAHAHAHAHTHAHTHKHTYSCHSLPWELVVMHRLRSACFLLCKRNVPQTYHSDSIAAEVRQIKIKF